MIFIMFAINFITIIFNNNAKPLNGETHNFNAHFTIIIIIYYYY